MTIRPRGSAFMVDVKVGASQNPTGRVVRVRVTAKDMPTARRLEAEIRAEVMKHGSWASEETLDRPSRSGKASGTLAAALEEAWNYPSGRRQGWKFAKSGKLLFAKARECIDFLGPDRHASTVTPEDLDRLTNFLIKKKNAQATAALKIGCLMRVLWHAQRKGWITQRPIWERPAPSKPREFIFSLEMEEKVIKYFEEETMDHVMRDVFIIGIETGLRLGEILSSTADEWLLEDRIVMVRARHAKSGRARAVTLTDRAIETVTPYLDRTKEGKKLFPRSKHQVAMRMRDCRDFLKVDDLEFVFHATRHTRATRLARATRDPFVVMSQLGHSSVETSMRYIKMAAMDIGPTATPTPNRGMQVVRSRSSRVAA